MSEIIRKDFERRNVDLEKKLEQMEEEKTNLRLDIDVQKFETEKLRKEKNKAKEELMQNEVLEKSLLDSQREKCELKDRVAELERSLCQYQNRNSAIELKASLSKIEEMKKRIEELETALRNCEIQIKYLKANESRNNEQLTTFRVKLGAEIILWRKLWSRFEK
ncbi:hypothetical protein Gotur_025488 [Gossypium turneri]